MSKYFKLRAGVNIFHDPTQEKEELKTLYPKQALELKETNRVKRALSNGALELVDKKEAKEINDLRAKGINASKEKAKAERKKYQESVSGENEDLKNQLEEAQNKLSEKENELDSVKEQRDSLIEDVKLQYLEVFGEVPVEGMTVEEMKEAIENKK